MAVRYVKSIHFFKAFADGFHRAGIGDGPQDVGNAVVRGEIVLRFVEFDPFPDDAGKALVLAVGQEYRFRLGGTGVKVLNAVQLLFPAGQFMLLMTSLAYSSTEAQPTMPVCTRPHMIWR